MTPSGATTSAAPPYQLSIEEVLAAQGVTLERGLEAREVEARRARFGPNRLQAVTSRSAWRILVDQLTSFIVVLLLVATGLSASMGELVEAVAIGVAIVINAVIGFVTEWQAVRDIEALRQLDETTARVRRGGEVATVPSVDLVPGDVVLLEAGDVLPADLRLAASRTLQVDESALTGESLPVTKGLEAAPGEVPLAERSAAAWKGTTVTRGAAEGVVVATGMGTEIGQIQRLVGEARSTRSGLERRLDRLGARLVWVSLGIVALLALTGIWVGHSVALMVQTAIALAVAVVPEGLPIVATVALARGMWRMARRQALVRSLPAVETFGELDVVFTDKTGTLTENRMVVRRLVLPGGGDVRVENERLAPDGRPDPDPALGRALEVAVLCNEAELAAVGPGHGDPMELALLRLGAAAGLERAALLERAPLVEEEPFDETVRMMATYHRRDGGCRVAVKGAPEAVLAACTRVAGAGADDALLDDAGRAGWAERNRELAGDGLRVLALAERALPGPCAAPFADLTLLGLVGLEDPPRPEVRDAIAACRQAGIRVVMLTGDQPGTARAIARATGLLEAGDEAAPVESGDLPPLAEMDESQRRRAREALVFARVSPRQKLDLVTLHQEAGSVVAMTGDGINDTPALKKADLGIAMGQRGTQAARETADVVLKDDSFATIVMAIEQGRTIFNNIRRFVVYLLSGNLAEVLAVGAATLLRGPLPLLPLQILFINLAFDVFLALALGLGRDEPGVMRMPPRPRGEAILTREHWLRVSGYGVLIAACVLAAFGVALLVLERPPAEAVTISFLAFGFSRLWHVFNMRSRRSTLLRNDVTTNPFVWGAFSLCLGLLLAAVFVPPLARVLHVVPIGSAGWALVLGFSLVPLVVGQTVQRLRRGGGPERPTPRTPVG